MGEADDKMLKAIKHYQESLERHTKTGKSEKLLHAIGKLSLLPIRVWHLEETGVGRTVNGLKKFEGTVGEQARNLVDKWKFMVKGEEEKEEKEQNEPKSIKIEKVDAVVAPVQESAQTATRETKCDDDKRSYHSSNHSKSRSPHSDSQSSRYCDQSKANNSEDKSHKRHHSKITDYKSSPSDSEIASKRHKVIKTEVKQKHSKYSDKSSDSESDESDSSNQSTSRRIQCDSSPARSTSGSSDNSSSDSSESSSSDEDDSDKNDNRKRHSSNDSDSDGYSHKKSNYSRSDNKSKSNGVNSEYSKIDDSKIKSKNNQSDSSDVDGRDFKHKEKLDKDTKQSSSKNDEKRSRHHNSKSESNKSKHTSEKSREPESKSSSLNSKKSEPRESESVRGQDKSKDRGSHRSSTKSSKSEDNKKDDSNKEKSHKEKKDDKSESTSKRSREESSSRESKKCKTSSDTKDSSRSHDHSSSSKKDRDKHSVKDEKQKETYKQPKEKKTVSETSKDKISTSAESKSNKIPKKLLDGIDSGSGTSFADVLGMLEAPVYSKSKKKSSANEETIPSSSKKTSSVPREDKTARGSKPIGESASFKTNGEIPNLLKDPAGLDPLDISISSLLPSITPNYRPLGVTLESSKPMYMDDEAFSRVITAKHQRTKVYSGNKASFTKVPTLFDLCSRILQDNLDALEYTGGVPYSILKPILEKANPNQLYLLEFHNPYLIEDTDELWQLHCQKEFRNKKREELESWREMYLRCLDEREAKLKALTANIKQSQDKSIPVRQTKLAYVDSVVKPPRNIARKQVKNGISIDIKKPSQTPTERLNQLAKSGEASKIAVPNPSRAAVERSSSSSSHIKPKKAPLMAKTLSLLKNRYGRR